MISCSKNFWNTESMSSFSVCLCISAGLFVGFLWASGHILSNLASLCFGRGDLENIFFLFRKSKVGLPSVTHVSPVRQTDVHFILSGVSRCQLPMTEERVLRLLWIQPWICSEHCFRELGSRGGRASQGGNGRMTGAVDISLTNRHAKNSQVKYRYLYRYRFLETHLFVCMCLRFPESLKVPVSWWQNQTWLSKLQISDIDAFHNSLALRGQTYFKIHDSHF